jgi:hypothetical protein
MTAEIDHARGEILEKDIPAEVLERLHRVPYFRAAYEPDGLSPQSSILCHLC